MLVPIIKEYQKSNYILTGKLIMDIISVNANVNANAFIINLGSNSFNNNANTFSCSAILLEFFFSRR